jgi:hypothetical protein
MCASPHIISVEVDKRELYVEASSQFSVYAVMEKTVFELIKESLADFHLASYLIDEVQIGSVDSVSKLWEDILSCFRTIKSE